MNLYRLSVYLCISIKSTGHRLFSSLCNTDLESNTLFFLDYLQLQISHIVAQEKIYPFDSSTDIFPTCFHLKSMRSP